MIKNFIILWGMLGLILPISVSAEGRRIGNEVNVKTEIVGAPKKFAQINLSLYGYTSPQAKVHLTGQLLAKTASSRTDGYFSFTNITADAKTRELCLTSEDRNNRTSYPTCFTTPGEPNHDITLGPYILPPTLSLDKGSLQPGETIAGRGETIPGSQVDISFFQAGGTPKLLPFLSISAPTYAYSLPKYNITTDQTGSFEFSLPSEGATSYRLYANTSYQKSPSGKSTTLLLNISWAWLVFVTYLLGQIVGLLPYLIFILLILLFFRNKKTARRKSVLRNPSASPLWKQGKRFTRYIYKKWWK